MPIPTPLPTPVENFASFIRGLTGGVSAMSGGDRLSCLLIGLIVTLLHEIEWGFAQLAARIAAGADAPRLPPAADRPPRRPSKLPTRVGWLLPPVTDGNADRSHLHRQLRDPETVALPAAGPAAMARPAKSRPPRKPSPAAPKAEPPRPGPPLPEWVRERRKPWSLARIRGSPRSA